MAEIAEPDPSYDEAEQAGNNELVELMHRSADTDAMHYGVRADCQLSACVRYNNANHPPVHCGGCDAPLSKVSGRWVDPRNAAHGGTYDHCPVNPDHEHKAVR